MAGTALNLAVAGRAAAVEGWSYAALRVVRAEPGTPGQPEIVVPAGYSLLPGPTYQAASRAEFTAFVQGPTNSAGVRVAVRWPGQRIRAVVAGERRLPLLPDADGVGVDLPVFRPTPTADSATVQVWSQLSSADTGIRWLVEHNDPERAVGHWAAVAWPAGPVRAVVSYTAACATILRESGLAAEARRRGHFFQLQGFETNTMLHQDNPPHWHLSYYPGPTMGAAKATVPHFWVDKQGRTFYNGQDVQGSGRTPYRAGQPAPIRDATGTVVLTTTIRHDGGLDLEPPAGPRYSIVSPATDFTGPILILRDDDPWRTVATSDNIETGRLVIETRGITGKPRRLRDLRYDPLTGVLLP